MVFYLKSLRPSENLSSSYFNFYKHFKSHNIVAKLSYGKYLAGDVGATFELSRKFNNGMEVGGFFTRTDVTKQQYGEGSFDKGVFLKIPLDGIGDSSIRSIVWRPLTKDPGSKLKRPTRLYDHTSRY